MRLCVPVPCFFKGIDFCEAIKTVSSLGFDAAETYHWESLDLDITKRALDDYGVELISMCTTEFRMTDPSYRELWLDGLKRSCEAANKLGVKRLITQVGPDTGAERKAQRDSIVTALNLAAPILEAHGVTLMPEPLNSAEKALNALYDKVKGKMSEKRFYHTAEVEKMAARLAEPAHLLDDAVAFGEQQGKALLKGGLHADHHLLGDLFPDLAGDPVAVLAAGGRAKQLLFLVLDLLQFFCDELALLVRSMHGSIIPRAAGNKNGQVL